MKSLNEYIIEKILINKSSKFSNIIKVDTIFQLLSIIKKRYDNYPAARYSKSGYRKK